MNINKSQTDKTLFSRSFVFETFAAFRIYINATMIIDSQDISFFTVSFLVYREIQYFYESQLFRFVCHSIDPIDKSNCIHLHRARWRGFTFRGVIETENVALCSLDDRAFLGTQHGFISH